MLIIFGFRGYADVISVLMMQCPRCGRTCEHAVVKQGRKFTLFFIPLFSVSTQWLLHCSFCREERWLSKQDAEMLISGENRQVAAPHPGSGQPQGQWAQGQWPTYPQQRPSDDPRTWR